MGFTFFFELREKKWELCRVTQSQRNWRQLLLHQCLILCQLLRKKMRFWRQKECQLLGCVLIKTKLIKSMALIMSNVINQDAVQNSSSIQPPPLICLGMFKKRIQLSYRKRKLAWISPSKPLYYHIQESSGFSPHFLKKTSSSTWLVYWSRPSLSTLRINRIPRLYKSIATRH